MKKSLLYIAAASVMLLCSAYPNRTALAKENGKTADNSAAYAQITFAIKEDCESAEDGTLLYTNRCSYPVVTIEGNEDAADKINAAIQAEMESFLADTSTHDECAEAEYEWGLSQQEPHLEYHFYSYYDKFDAAVTRNDNNVISFLITISNYSGGPHDYYHSIGLNFNAKTGEAVSLSELSEKPSVFYFDTLAYLKKLADTDTYRNLMWEISYNWKNFNYLGQVLYQDGRWYLSTAGLVFFSHPYELGAGYAGEIEFIIPYADLKEMEFQEEYSYQENLTIKLQTEEVCSFDLNGDRQKEKIQFYIDKPGIASTDVHFIINGIDYAKEQEELSGQLSDDDYVFCWAQCFLYDMDAEDDTIEIAFQMNYYNQEEDIITPCTFLYRYQKNASLTYLGKVEGTVTDLTVFPDWGWN